MPKAVRLPSGEIKTFPDEATPEMISEALGLKPASRVEAATSVPKNKWVSLLDDATGWASSIGAGIGGVAGGVAGAALGGAAGEGYGQLASHATELPGAVMDVARNLVRQPKATLKGFAQGATGGALSAGAAAGVGAATEGAGRLAAKPLQPLASKVANRVMQSELGQIPAKALATYKTSTQEIAKTLLDKKVMVTERGLAKIDKLLDLTEADLNGILGNLQGTIDPKKVATKTAETLKQFGPEHRINPKEGMADIRAVTREFLRTHKRPLSGTEAQTLKRGGYRELKESYGKLSSATKEAKKAILRGLREEIEGLAAKEGAGDVATLNQKERELLAAHLAIGRRIALTAQPSAAMAIWTIRHPLIESVAIARHLGIPVGSVVAQAVNGSLPVVAPNVARLLAIGLATGTDSGDEQSPPESTGPSTGQSTERLDRAPTGR